MAAPSRDKTATGRAHTGGHPPFIVERGGGAALCTGGEQDGSDDPLPSPAWRPVIRGINPV